MPAHVSSPSPTAPASSAVQINAVMRGLRASATSAAAPPEVRQVVVALDHRHRRRIQPGCMSSRRTDRAHALACDKEVWCVAAVAWSVTAGRGAPGAASLGPAAWSAAPISRCPSPDNVFGELPHGSLGRRCRPGTARDILGLIDDDDAARWRCSTTWQVRVVIRGRVDDEAVDAGRRAPPPIRRRTAAWLGPAAAGTSNRPCPASSRMIRQARQRNPGLAGLTERIVRAAR